MSEIEAFPRAVLSHHYPETPLHGDFTTIAAGQYEPIDVLVGGTPCQSFSVAGLRGGLADKRGNLALEYLRLADRLRPRWVVWENVPGVLSATSHDAPDPCFPPDDMDEGAEWVGEDEYDTDENHAFSCFLAGLSELGYGFAYRSFDAQFFGLAQRRERVFVVGHLGDWRRAAAVLFEPASLRGNPSPRRETGEGVAQSTGVSTAVSSGRGWWDDADIGATIRSQACVTKSDTLVTHALRADGFDAGEDGTGRGTPLVPVAFGRQNSSSQGDSVSEHHTPTLDKSKTPTVAFALGSHAGTADGDQTNRSHASGGPVGSGISEELAYTLRGGRQQSVASSAVRRLTPTECERLQGFPDGYTAIPYRNGIAADGPRYKALGNSMAVPCMAWIGRRIAAEAAP